MRPPPLTHAQLFFRFLKFGAMVFGGPVAQIAMLKRELIEHERWMPVERFNRLLAVMQVLPGPEAHELCVHLGMRAKGRLGGLVAGLGFMLPGFALMLLLSWLYFRIDLDRSWISAAFLGLQAAVFALIVRAVHRIGRHILVDRWAWGLAGLAMIGALWGASFWITLPAAGLIYGLAVAGRARLATGATVIAIFLAAFTLTTTPALTTAASSNLAAGSLGSISAAVLFWSGLKAGLLTFGGAYTAIPFLRDDAARQGWMSDGQFLDGLALSGVLPAPLIIFGTFVGYVAGGPGGALAITAGIFLPAFAFSLIFYDRLDALVEMDRVKAGLAGVAAGVVGLIAATTVQLFGTLVTPPDRAPYLLVIAAVALAALYAWRGSLATPVVLAAAALAGALVVPS